MTAMCSFSTLALSPWYRHHLDGAVSAAVGAHTLIVLVSLHAHTHTYTYTHTHIHINLTNCASTANFEPFTST